MKEFKEYSNVDLKLESITVDAEIFIVYKGFIKTGIFSYQKIKVSIDITNERGSIFDKNIKFNEVKNLDIEVEIKNRSYLPYSDGKTINLSSKELKEKKKCKLHGIYYNEKRDRQI